MKGYIEVNLAEMLEELGEDETKSHLSDFYCPLNADVEDFLRNKSIEFSRQGLSATHLVFTSYKDSSVLVGYYTLANKILEVSKRSLSKNMQKRIRKFAQIDEALKTYFLPSLLIAQLGKNYNNGYNELISGDELLKLAINKIKEIQLVIGGNFVYLECEDKPVLTEFYKQHGFDCFGKRELEGDEIEMFEGDYLVQMLKYISSKDKI